SRTPSRPRLMVLTGVAGAGKSALLSELATRAALAGRPVIHVSCGTFEGSLALAKALVRRIAAEAGAHAADLPLDAQPGPAADQERTLDLWTNAASKWAGSLARSAGGLVVLLDDAEQLDEGSRAWIRRVASRAEPVPIAWLIARRRSERVPE